MPTKDPDPVVAHFATNVRRCRARRGWTQEELAERMNSDVRWIQRVEAGRVNVSISSLVKFAEVFNVKPGTLLWKTKVTERPSGRPRGRSKKP